MENLYDTPQVTRNQCSNENTDVSVDAFGHIM
jgi:hypothetical protein